MYNKEIKIGLMKYLPSSSRITLNPKFRFHLFNEAIKIAGNRTKLSKIIGVNKTSIWEWKVGRGSRKPTLDAVLKCTEIVGVDELRKYIIGATSRLTGGTIYVKHWKLNLDANFAEWLGFKLITEPEPTTGAYRIAISNRRDLEKYISEIGFGHHEMRNQKMREILSSYSLKEYKLRSERFKEVLSLFEKSQKMTGSIIAKQLNTDYKQINHILNQMLREKLLQVDNSSKPYIYSPS